MQVQRSASVSLASTSEVVQRLGRGWRQGATVGQIDRPGDIAEGNESAALVAAMIFVLIDTHCVTRRRVSQSIREARRRSASASLAHQL